MYVYLVEYDEYDIRYVVGVYSTKENAEQAVAKDAKREHHYRNDYNIRRTKIDKGIYD